MMREYEDDVERVNHYLLSGQQRVAEELLRSRFSHDPNIKSFPELASWLDAPDGPPPYDLAATAQDRMFLANIHETKRHLSRARLAWNSGSVYRVSRDYDFLALNYGRDPADWSLLQFLNFVMMQRIQPRRPAAVVVSMRDDGIVMLEWIAHYRALGFEGIFIYSNDNEDGSTALLERLAALNEIVFFDNVTRVNHEIKIAEHMIHFSHELRDFEWVLFVDSDEFLIPAPQFHMSAKNILDAVVERIPHGPPGAILYNWKIFLSGSGYARRPGLLIERFKFSCPERHVKSFARVQSIYSMRHNHAPELRPPSFCIDSGFKQIENPGAHGQTEPKYTGGQINHYWTRSFEEFSLKKMRGDRTSPDAEAFRREFRQFFEWNGPERAVLQGDERVEFDPVPDELLRKVRLELSRLTNLPGVQPLVEQIEKNFARLVARYDYLGGLRAIYDDVRKAYAWANEPS